MKKILLLLLFVSTLFSDIRWADDLDDAIELAQKEHKKVMVMLSRRGCSACEYMKGVVFEDKNFMKSFNKNYIAVHVDVKEDFVPEGLEYFATPTFYFFNENEKVIERINGASNSKSFADTINTINAKK